jgi:UDP-N-acetylmuramate: L-alanyl-gamma-D-glutamyl-meso-diaminopimelate ligase
MMKDSGYEVTGSDEGVYPPMSDFLAQRGIGVLSGYSIANLQPEPDLIVLGNALSRGNPEVEYALNFRLRYSSFPEALKDFFLRDRIPVVVAGTHGKTTTTSMISWILHHADFAPNFLIGGIAENFQSSYGLEGGKHFVIEGDEYDSAFFDKGAKFLHYLPYAAVIGNVEHDHADIYPTLEDVKLQFRRFVNLLPERGFLAIGGDSPAAVEVASHARCRTETFGIDAGNLWSARNIGIESDGRLCFDALYRQKLFRRLRLRIYGNFNIRNVLGATAVLNHLGVPEDSIREGMETFEGVRRRLQLRAEVEGVKIYEDFAHHPTAVRETLHALREALRPARLWAVYEPRSATSRRNLFQEEMAEALAAADLVAMPPLYRPDKVPAEQRLDIARLIEAVRGKGCTAWNLDSVEGIIRVICEEARSGDVIAILSNGGFGGIYEKLPVALAGRSKGRTNDAG